MPKVRLGLVGGGYLGAIHARLALSQPDVQLVAIADPDPAARQRLAPLGVPVVDHIDELIDHVEATIVACPTRLHYSIARQLLEHDIHLFIEKPVTATVAELDSLIQLTESRHLIVQVGHVERFNPAFTAARPLVDRPCWIQASRTSGYSCRSTDIGVVADLMIHDLDLVLMLIDSPLVEVHAVGTVVVGPYEDQAEAWLTFANGAAARLSASRVSQRAERSMHIVMPDGVLELDFASQRCWLERPNAERLAAIKFEGLSPEQREVIKSSFFEEYLPRLTIPVTQRNALYDEQRDFLSSVRTGRPPRVSARDVRPVMVLVEQIEQQIARFAQRHRLKLPATRTQLVRPSLARRKAG